MAIATQRSGSSSRLLEADQTFDPNDHQELRRHLSCLIIFQGAKKIEQLRENCHGQLDINRSASNIVSRLDVVQTRLINANLRRRHRFLYAQSRSSKYERQTLEQDPSTRAKISKDATQPVETQENAGKVSNTRPGGEAQEAGLSQQPPFFDPIESTGSEAQGPVQSQDATQTPSEQSWTELSSTASGVSYPLPPALEASQTFKCPCCCLPQPLELPSLPSRWRSA